MITPLEELRRRNDAEIDAMLKNQAAYSKEELRAAALIYEERNLADPKRQALIVQYSDIKAEVYRLAVAGASTEQIKSYLQEKGVAPHDIDNMLRRAQQKYSKEHAPNVDPKKYYITLITTAIISAIIAFLLVRYFTQ